MGWFPWHKLKNIHLSAYELNQKNLYSKQYLTDLKLDKSRKLLVTTESSVSVIANSLGFEDQLAFSKVFKKHFSLSPSEYRKKTRMLATDSKK